MRRYSWDRIEVMRHDDLLAIGSSRDRATLEAVLIRTAFDLGFDLMSSFLVTERPGRRPLIEIVENTPEGYRETSRESEPAQRCPVLQHIKRSHRPIIYNQWTYLQAGAMDLWELQAQFGYKAGIVVAMHLPEGRHFVLGVDRDQDVSADESERLRLVGILHSAAACAVEPALRLLGGESPTDCEPPRLTQREREVLRWTALGKSAWLIGEIMNLSESTVNFHLRNAMRKLKCNSKHVAAYKASMLGLIST